jgi:hypothetical protein
MLKDSSDRVKRVHGSPLRKSRSGHTSAPRSWNAVGAASATPRIKAGHPKLRNALLRPNMEEIGSRFAVFPFDGMAGHQADYIAWLLERRRAEGAEPETIIAPAAVDLLAARLRTPLQIKQYLTRAFEKTFEVGGKVVTATLAETVLSRQIDDLEPRLTRYGYDVKSIAEEFRIEPADVRLFLQGQLDLARARELTEQMLVAGLPV